MHLLLQPFTRERKNKNRKKKTKTQKKKNAKNEDAYF